MNVNQIKKICNFAARKQWGFSSSGRALGSQSKGGRFESGILHSFKRQCIGYQRLTFFNALFLSAKCQQKFWHP